MDLTPIEQEVVMEFRAIQQRGYGTLEITLQAGKVVNLSSKFPTPPERLRAIQEVVSITQTVSSKY